MNRKNRYKSICVLFLILFCTLNLNANGGTYGKGRLSVFGGVGISSARGDYASEYDAAPEFSFYPGFRLRLDDSLMEDTLLLFDFGYLETGFVGYVQPTSSYFWRTYSYLNLNAMFGKQINMIYLAGGIYLAMGLDAYDYRGYTEEWVTLDSNGDFGLVGEVGIEPFPFLSLGIQGRYGLKSVGTSVDVKNMGLLATIGIHFLRF